MIAHPLESFDGGSWCEVSGPIGVRVTLGEIQWVRAVIDGNSIQIWVPRIWEEVISLCGPRNVGIVKRLQIARRCRIEEVHFESVILTLIRIPKQKIEHHKLCRERAQLFMPLFSLSSDLLYQLVQIFEPHVSYLKIEVFTHGDYDIVRTIRAWHVCDVSNKVFDLMGIYIFRDRGKFVSYVTIIYFSFQIECFVW